MRGGVPPGLDAHGLRTHGPDAHGPDAGSAANPRRADTIASQYRRAADWLATLPLSPISVSGTGLALGICAAVWFSAGTRPANFRGAVALVLGYLTALTARQLAGHAVLARRQAKPRPAAATARMPTAGRLAAGRARLAGTSRAGWLAALGQRVGDAVVLAGLAFGAAAQGWAAMWPLAVTVLTLIAVRDTMTACSGPADRDRDGQVQHAILTVLAMPAGGRVLLIAVAAPLFGARATLLALLDWGIIAIGYGISSRPPVRRRPRPARPRPVPSVPGSLAVLLQPAQDAEPPGPSEPARPAGPVPPPQPPAGGARDWPAWDRSVPGQSAPGQPAPVRAAPGRPAAGSAGPAGRQPIPVLRMELSAPPPGVIFDADSMADMLSAFRGPVPGWTENQAAWADGGQPGSDGLLAAEGLLAEQGEIAEDDVIAEDGWREDGAWAAGTQRPQGRLAEGSLAEDGWREDGAWAAGTQRAGDRLAEDQLAEDQVAGGRPGAGRGARDFPARPQDAAGARGQAAAGPSAAPAATVSQYDASEQRALALILRCRDDGAVSRWFGRLVGGQLVPVPPALLALAAVALLAHLGLRGLPGLLILAPAIVMLVAAPGSSHRHDGRIDWLVPAVLQGAQYIYIVALGVADRVPAGVIFLLCAVVALRYADLGSAGSPPLPARRAATAAATGATGLGAAWAAAWGPRRAPGDGGAARRPAERGGWLGWEGRMLCCGLGAAMGIAMLAYLALAAYLGVLICWKIMTSYAGVRDGLREGDRR